MKGPGRAPPTVVLRFLRKFRSVLSLCSPTWGLTTPVLPPGLPTLVPTVTVSGSK